MLVDAAAGERWCRRPFRRPTFQSIDLRTMVFALALTAVTGLVFGLAPHRAVSGDTDPRGLREDVRSGGGRKERLRSALVVVEVVASIVLLISCGLLMRAIWNVQARDPGFRAEGVLTLRTALRCREYDETARRTAFYSRVLDQRRGASRRLACRLHQRRCRWRGAAASGRSGSTATFRSARRPHRQHALRQPWIFRHDGHSDPRRPRCQRLGHQRPSQLSRW